MAADLTRHVGGVPMSCDPSQADDRPRPERAARIRRARYLPSRAFSDGRGHVKYRWPLINEHLSFK